VATSYRICSGGPEAHAVIAPRVGASRGEGGRGGLRAGRGLPLRQEECCADLPIVIDAVDFDRLEANGIDPAALEGLVTGDGMSRRGPLLPEPLAWRSTDHRTEATRG
jgi:hypothetical protein